MKISIIIPVYNAEKYLKRCLDSVLAQTYKELEVLVVDDGASDSSPEICDSYAGKDARITVLHQANAGQSKARNVAMEMCSGEYIMFVDSDDELPKDAVENLVRPIQEKRWDVSAGLCSVIQGTRKRTVEYDFEDGRVSRQGEGRKRYERIKTESIFGYAVAKLYRKRFLDEHGIRFDDIRRMIMEDSLFNLKVWAFNPEYFMSGRSVYFYYIHEGSTSNKVMDDIGERAAEMPAEYVRFLQKNGFLQEQKDLLIPLTARVFCWAMIHPCSEGQKKRECLKQRIQNFTEHRELMHILRGKESISQLWKIPSFMQRVFYSICIWCLERGLTGILTSIFIICGSLLEKYAHWARNKQR